VQEQLFMQDTSQFIALTAGYAFELAGNLMFGTFRDQSFVALADVLFSHCKGDFLTHPLDQSLILV
jgi:hypothetical protein